MTGTAAAPARESAESGPSPGFGLSLALCLPRDAVTVPIIRRVVRQALDELGVLPEITADIVLALCEACANVLDHSGRGDAYDVSVSVVADRCELRVVDVGHGFDHVSVTRAAEDGPDLDAERGRGLTLMHALVDQIELISQPEAGTLVRLVKQLAFAECAPARHLIAPPTP